MKENCTVLLFIRGPPNKTLDFSIILGSLIIYLASLYILVFKIKCRLDTPAKIMITCFLSSCLLKLLAWSIFFSIENQDYKLNAYALLLIEDYTIWFLQQLTIFYFVFEMISVKAFLKSEQRDDFKVKQRFQKLMRYAFFSSYSIFFMISNGINIFYYFFN